MELNKLVTKKIIEKCQELLVDELCNPKYSRNGEKEHKRAGKSKRTLGTRFGKVDLELIKVRSQGRIFKPINELIELDGKKLYQRDISFIGIDLATKLTYLNRKKNATYKSTG